MGEFPVQDGQLWLFQGDSITDCGRRGGPPLGGGYAWLFSELVTAMWPERDIRYINKGIGGDNTVGLRNRWEDDVVRHQPNWLSLLIGINDLHTWLGDPANGISPALYKEKYDSILASTKEQTPAKLLLIDPFYISIDTCESSFRKRVLDTLPEYIAVVDEMAAKYDALHVKLHDIYAAHLKFREADYFCPEPVHPNHAGHLVIAGAMVKALMGVGC
jgi:lysophospholipase L1-like esterase